MSTTTKPAHLSHDPEIILDSCEACCWEQYGTHAEFEREHRVYQAMLHNLAEHGPNSRVRMQAHDLLTQIALSEAETDFEKYKIHRAADEWVRGEAVREAAEARAAALLAPHRALLEDMAAALVTRRELSDDGLTPWLGRLDLEVAAQVMLDIEQPTPPPD